MYYQLVEYTENKLVGNSKNVVAVSPCISSLIIFCKSWYKKMPILKNNNEDDHYYMIEKSNIVALVPPLKRLKETFKPKNGLKKAPARRMMVVGGEPAKMLSEITGYIQTVSNDNGSYVIETLDGEYFEIQQENWEIQ